MFSSTIIATVGRPTLARAVESVIKQTGAALAFEVIVVNDSGRPLTPAGWMRSECVTIIETQRRERSVARNAGAALARGGYLHFLDDDDWLAPEALSTWKALAAQTQVAWLYGSTQLVDRSGHPLIKLQPNLTGNCFTQALAGEWLPLQASLIRADVFFRLGGFNPLITGPEDIDLWRRFASVGEVAGAPGVVVNISMGLEGSTTPHMRHTEYSRWARERILSQPSVLQRLWNSAPSAFWQGRVGRAYLSSAVWNAKHGRGLTAASRALFFAAVLLRTGPRLATRAFWRAVTRPYDSQTFHAGLAAKQHVASSAG